MNEPETPSPVDDPLARAAAGPPIDWDDEDKSPEDPEGGTAEPDPLRSIYGPPPGEQRPETD